MKRSIAVFVAGVVLAGATQAAAQSKPAKLEITAGGGAVFFTSARETQR